MKTTNINGIEMTITERREMLKLFTEGCGLWYEYIGINGYSRKTTKEGIKRLSRYLNLNVSYIEKRIWIFTEGRDLWHVYIGINGRRLINKK
jgi:N-dimethylarginine dimethylaminohydrolase